MHKLERVGADRLVAAWEIAVPAAATISRQALDHSTMPRIVVTYECEACAAQFFDPTWAAGPEWYSVVEDYGNRWEYEQALRDLRGRRARIP